MAVCPKIPSGLWAISSGLSSTSEASRWAEGVASASACTFRLPQVASTREALACARALRERFAWLGVHGDSSLAQLAEADAMIAGSRGLPLSELPPLLSQSSLCLGATARSKTDGLALANEGVDFLLLSPIWETPSKKGVFPPLGTDVLAECCEGLPVPVIALGGIVNPEQVAECRAAGAHGVAVLRATHDPVLFDEMSLSWDEAS